MPFRDPRRARRIRDRAVEVRIHPRDACRGLEDESSEMNPPSTLTCDAGTFDASNLKFPVDAVVSVAMFGNDFYDETTVAYGKYVERTVRLRCARGTAGSNCQYTAKTHCNDAGTPNDEVSLF